ncbi:MAG: hypothetical protein ABIH25_02685 [Candidatus Woesearchaeota archaeon]
MSLRNKRGEIIWNKLGLWILALILLIILLLIVFEHKGSLTNFLKSIGDIFRYGGS